MSDRDRIDAALDAAMRYASIDGAHHKAWVIDQMVRALTGCPVVVRKAVDCRGRPYEFDSLGESEEYAAFVAKHNRPDGGDGDAEYEWQEGVAP